MQYEKSPMYVKRALYLGNHTCTGLLHTPYNRALFARDRPLFASDRALST